MRICLNGKVTEVPDGLTIAGLLAWKKLQPETVIVEHNRELVRRESFEQTPLKENDRLEILRFVEGG